MFRTRVKSRRYGLFVFILHVWVILGCSLCLAAAESDEPEDPNQASGKPDPARYIGLDEIEPGMDAYCLTEYGTDGIERFDLKVVDVVRDFEPGRDVILVEGTDARFIHTGPVAGCSGSPVYIDGRLAGALAFAWMNSKDPLYGATAIEDMLKVGEGRTDQAPNPGPAYTFDYSKPIDLAAVDRQITSPPFARANTSGGISTLPCPLITSGLPTEVCEQLSTAVKPFGFMVIPGIGGAGQAAGADDGGASDPDEKRKLTPGACLAVPLVTGDMTMAVYGTVTEVRGQNVYGFGHAFMGYGPVDLPMATGKVHTVITSSVRSSKLARVVEIVGALRTDEGAGILGQVGAKAKTFGVTVRVNRYNDQERLYNCQVACNRLLTPSSLRSIVSGAGLYLGDLPPDHTVQYKTSIAIEGFEPIVFENVSTGFGLMQMASEGAGAVALLMNNPYAEAVIESVDFDVRIVPKDTISHIWSAELSDPKVKAGEEVQIDVIIESVRTEKKKYRIDMKIPEDLRPGKYELVVCGSRDYELFLMKVVPYKFIGQTLPDLVQALGDTLKVRRDRLYCYLVLPSGGIILEKAELPDLPATKMLVLQSAKRPIATQPYPHWLEKTVDTGTVVLNKRTMRITVEK